MPLRVYREQHNELQLVGTLGGDRREDASFSYAAEYLESEDARPISLSLPLTARKEFYPRLEVLRRAASAK